MALDHHAAKSDLRRQMRAILASFPQASRVLESRQACEVLRGAFPPNRSSLLMATLPIPGEIDVQPYLQGWLDAGSGIVLPRVEESGVLSLWRVQDLNAVVQRGRLALREPDPTCCQQVREEDLTLVLVPGLAFDAEGGRLGRGGGYYDRLLTRLAGRIPHVAVCHSCQLLERVPLEPHDVRVDRIIAAHRDLRVRR